MEKIGFNDNAIIYHDLIDVDLNHTMTLADHRSEIKPFPSYLTIEE